MTIDVAEYRKCILEAVERAQFVDPETGFMFIPISALYQKGTESDTGVWFLDGPLWLFYLGLLDPSDKRFDDMEAYVDKVYGRNIGIYGRMAPGSDMWYVNQGDDAYYNVYLARGQYEKALLVFNSNLAYCLSSDAYQAVERIDAGDPGFCPLQPNASGQGRLIEMMRRMVIDEQDSDKGILWLLRGCPRQWFAKGKSIIVKNAPTLFGKMALTSTAATSDTISIEVDCPDREPVSHLKLVVRHPDRKTMIQATVNGSVIAHSGEIIDIANAQGHLRVVCKYTQ